jgi:segregation and condensation protein A
MQTGQGLFSLDNFEGTIDFLLSLVQKNEIDIYEVPIQDLIVQFLQKFIKNEEENLEEGAEFVGATAYLIWLKSKKLLPTHEQDPLQLEESFEDPRFEVIHHLIDYCRFKQAAKELTSRQERQQGCYFRGIEPPEWKKPLGIDHVSLEELSDLFKVMIEKASKENPKIHEEHWKVSDKLEFIRLAILQNSPLSLSSLLFPDKSRMEIIIIFLAILELMKSGEVAIGKERETGELMILAKG